MYRKVRNELPNYFCFTQFQFDQELLVQELQKFIGGFGSLKAANGALIQNHEKLYSSLEGRYDQVPLTTLRKDFVSSPLTPSASSRKEVLKNSELNERLYGEPTEAYRGSYFFQCLSQLQTEIYRVRLSRLKAGEVIDWHIDYDPGYATRLLLPIVTNDQVIYSTERNGKIESVQMKADGHPWFLNTGFRHRVENKGPTDRIVLLASVDGTRLFEEMKSCIDV